MSDRGRLYFSEHFKSSAFYNVFSLDKWNYKHKGPKLGHKLQKSASNQVLLSHESFILLKEVQKSACALHEYFNLFPFVLNINVYFS